MVNICIIGGSGQTGQMFVNAFSKKGADINLTTVIREKYISKFSKIFPSGVVIKPDLNFLKKSKVDIIIAATPNPADELLLSLRQFLKDERTLILPQNGVDISETAVKIFGDSKIHLIRAGLFTTITTDNNGLAKYNENKLRIGLSDLKTQGVNDEKISSALAQAELNFRNAGFDTKIFSDYKSLEWTKLITNLLGSSASITGLTTLDTFSDEKLFEFEFNGLRERLEIMNSANIKFADIPWSKIQMLKLAKNIKPNISKYARKYIAKQISAGRNNISPSAFRKLADQKPTELEYYHKPFIELGLRHGLRSSADEVIVDITADHEKGRIDLNSMDSNTKKELILSTYARMTEKPLIPRSPVITYIVGKLADVFSKKLEINGRANLKSIRESLNKGKSTIILANHSSHADHPLIVKSLRESGFKDLADRIIFIAGMKVKNEFLGKCFSDAFAHILVSTPEKGEISEEEKRKAQMINIKGFSEINRLMNKGHLFVLYAEGTRSRNKKLLKAIPSVARYFENPNLEFLLPTAIEGAVDLLPVGESVPRFADTKVTFGEPIQPDELFSKAFEDLPDQLKKLDSKDKSVRDKINELVIDMVMRRIAKLLPEQKRGYYF